MTRFDIEVESRVTPWSGNVKNAVRQFLPGGPLMEAQAVRAAKILSKIEDVQEVRIYRITRKLESTWLNGEVV